MKHNRIILFVTLLVAGLASCTKDKDNSAAPKVTTGVYVLCEGAWTYNNSMLTYYNSSTGTATTDFFAKANNGTGLGDTGNDMVIYGTKMYIVVNGSGVLIVADAHTGQVIANIPFKAANGANRQPRSVVPYQNKILVSAWDNKVSVIDTSNLTIEQDIAVGANPEQMAIIGDKLYVTNSGSQNAVADSTISVVSLSTMKELQKITAAYNPSRMVADESGNLYVVCSGNYGNIKPKLVKISTSTNSIVKITDTVVDRIKYYGGALYATGGFSGSGYVRKLSTTDFSQQSPSFVTDGTRIVNPYNLNVDPANGDVYITDAKDYVTSGEVFCFDKNGKKKFSFSTTPAVNPSIVVFIKD
jgi:YVTN family beta-propeller protein